MVRIGNTFSNGPFSIAVLVYRSVIIEAICIHIFGHSISRSLNHPPSLKFQHHLTNTKQPLSRGRFLQSFRPAVKKSSPKKTKKHPKNLHLCKRQKSTPPKKKTPHKFTPLHLTPKLSPPPSQPFTGWKPPCLGMSWKRFTIDTKLGTLAWWNRRQQVPYHLPSYTRVPIKHAATGKGRWSGRWHTSIAGTILIHLNFHRILGSMGQVYRDWPSMKPTASSPLKMDGTGRRSGFLLGCPAYFQQRS